jgi:hypothetical protein
VVRVIELVEALDLSLLNLFFKCRFDLKKDAKAKKSADANGIELSPVPKTLYEAFGRVRDAVKEVNTQARIHVFAYDYYMITI